MIEHWTKFEGTPIAARRKQIRVTLGSKYDFYLNLRAFEAMGKPEAVEMFFDELQKRIGFRKCDPDLPYAFPLVDKSQSRYHQISAAAFCTHFGIKAHRRVLFEHAYVDANCILVLDLKKTVIVGEASR